MSLAFLSGFAGKDVAMKQLLAISFSGFSRALASRHVLRVCPDAQLLAAVVGTEYCLAAHR